MAASVKASAASASHSVGAAALLAGVVVVLAAAVLVPAPATDVAQTTGDEPHYLLTAEAIAERGSLDLDGAYAGRAYAPYHDADLAPQGRPLADGRLVAPHDPLLPAVLALPLRLGGWVGAKLTLAAVAGATAASLVWVAAARFGVPPRRAAVVVAVLGASAPMATYGAQVYPELPAALAVTAGIGAVTGPPRRRSHALAVVAVVALPWLSVKYVPLAALLAAFAVHRVRRDRGWRAVGVLVALLAVAGGAYVAAHLGWYDGLTVYAAGRFFADHGGQLSVVGTDPNYLGRAVRLAGLLIDRDFGLATWQPAWLLAVPAVAALARAARRRADHGGHPVAASPGVVAVAVLAVGWAMATFVAATMHGWWLPGRHVVAALPAAVLAIAWWARAGRVRLGAVAALGALGVLAHLWLAVEASAGDLALVLGFADAAHPLPRAWRWLLPDYRALGPATWVRHGAWLAAGAAAAVGAWRVERSGDAPPVTRPGRTRPAAAPARRRRQRQPGGPR